MEVTCGHCNRKFNVDTSRAAELNAAKCLCGVRLSLRVGAGGANEPTRLGKYLLHRRIATGGMGEIWYGKIAGVEGFEREVAIKKMLPHLSADPNFITMMVKEAKLTVLLNHPNIVQVYDLAKENGEYYIAMEFVPGINVGAMLDYCRKAGVLVPVDMAVHIMMNVLKGLAYAHDLRSPDGTPMEILHRDVTPQNILVTRSGWVKITDFGIAKARNEISTTRPGMIKGKLGYLAPEQLTGADLDQRVDIFCAGILMWESLACRRLFKGVSEVDTFRLISEATIPPLSSIRDDVPEAVEQALRGALTREPEKRYTTGHEFYDALSQAISPKTPDDCAAASRSFFEVHDDLFVDLEATEADEIDPTVQIDITAEQQLVGIETLVAERAGESGLAAGNAGNAAAMTMTAPASARSVVVPLFVGALLVVGGGIGFWQLKERVLDKSTGGTNPAGTGRLTLEEVQLGVDAVSADVTECYGKGNRSFFKIDKLEAKLLIPSTGRVATVDYEPDIPGRVRSCSDDVLRQLKFRSHSQPKFEALVKLPNPKDNTPEPAKSLKSLSSGEIQGFIGRYSSSIVKCLQSMDKASAPEEVRPTITIDTSGRVGSVVIDPPLEDQAAQSCLTKVLKSIRFRKHPDKNLAPITIPLRIKKG